MVELFEPGENTDGLKITHHVRGSLRSFEERLITFRTWHGCIPATELAKAGFFYTHIGDFCRCVYCYVEIYKWEKDDHPVREHIKYSPNCIFAKVLFDSMTHTLRDDLSRKRMFALEIQKQYQLDEIRKNHIPIRENSNVYKKSILLPHIILFILFVEFCMKFV